MNWIISSTYVLYKSYWCWCYLWQIHKYTDHFNISPWNSNLFVFFLNSWGPVLPRNSRLETLPSTFLALTVKFLEDSKYKGCPLRLLMVDARRELSTTAWPFNCRPPGTMRSWPIPSWQRIRKTNCNQIVMSRYKLRQRSLSMMLLSLRRINFSNTK